MRSLARKPQVSRQTTPTQSMNPGRVSWSRSKDVHAYSHLQPSRGNPAAPRLLQANAETADTSSARNASARLAHNFARVPVFPSQSAMSASTPSTPVTSNPTRVPVPDARGSLDRPQRVATNTSVVSRENGVVTETTNGRGTPSAPTTTSRCAITSATFATVPSGTITAALNGSKLEGPFQIRADFTRPIPCNCSCGEYRQYVRGTFTANGRPVTHRLGPGRVLHPTNFQEDGDVSLGTVYGHRSVRGTKSRFTPDQAGGCRFEGEDEPGISSSSGTRVAMNLGFRGDLIDTCRGNAVLTSSSWSVVGSATIP